ncbi:MAG: hypothetical protein ACXABY_28390 [Candidatus Thorarchaeota archaeon]|jgi:hypothetical protein
MTMINTTSNFIVQCRAMLDELERVHDEATTEQEYFANRYTAMKQFGMQTELAELTYG